MMNPANNPSSHNRDHNQNREHKEFEEKVIQVNRVSKKTKGGNRMGFSVLMVVGDHKGNVGVGLGKAADVLGAIRKGVRKAKKRMLKVPLDGTTVPFPVRVKRGAAFIMLKPAPRGSGVIAGGPIRAVVEAAGIRDISSKIMGTNNQASNVYAAFAALQEIQKIVEIKGIKLKSAAEEEREAKQQEREVDREAQSKAKDKEVVEVKSEAKPATEPAKAKKIAAKAPRAKTASPVAKTRVVKAKTKKVEA